MENENIEPLEKLIYKVNVPQKAFDDGSNHIFVLYFSDENECSVNNGGCEHSCSNTIGSFHCKCPPGFTLSQDHRTCEGKNWLIQTSLFQNFPSSHDIEAV